MRTISLISDYGANSYRAGALKGEILSTRDDVRLIDISHDITPFEIDEASYILKMIYPSYPKGTIHVVSLFNYYAGENRLLVFERAGQFFIGPDNGIFSLVFSDLHKEVYARPFRQERFDFRKEIAYMISLLADEEPLFRIGEETTQVQQKLLLQPVVAADQIRGSIQYIDRYGNAVVNVSKDLFLDVQKGRPFSIYCKTIEPLQRIVHHYMEAEIGAPLCTFNTHNMMELAVNLGRADELLDLTKGEVIQIAFH